MLTGRNGENLILHVKPVGTAYYWLTTHTAHRRDKAQTLLFIF